MIGIFIFYIVYKMPMADLSNSTSASVDAGIPVSEKETKKPDPLDVLMNIKAELDKFFKEQEDKEKAFRSEIDEIKRSIENLKKAVSVPLTESPSSKDDLSGGDSGKKAKGEGGEDVTSPDVELKKGKDSPSVKTPAQNISVPEGKRALVTSDAWGASDVLRIIEKGLSNEELIRIERELARGRGVVFLG